MFGCDQLLQVYMGFGGKTWGNGRAAILWELGKCRKSHLVVFQTEAEAVVHFSRDRERSTSCRNWQHKYLTNAWRSIIRDHPRRNPRKLSIQVWYKQPESNIDSKSDPDRFPVLCTQWARAFLLFPFWIGEGFGALPAFRRNTNHLPSSRTLISSRDLKGSRQRGRHGLRNSLPDGGGFPSLAKTSGKAKARGFQFPKEDLPYPKTHPVGRAPPPSHTFKDR